MPEHCANCKQEIKLNHGTYGTWVHVRTLNTDCFFPDEKRPVAQPLIQTPHQLHKEPCP